ncbi:ankyrin repeat domain-containing protein 31 [Rhynchocyon petersi]
MEESAQTPDWDSDETVIEGSVSESDLEEDLPWKRFLFDQDESLRSESSFLPYTNGMCKGMPSPEIQLGFKLREYSQEQMNENNMVPVFSEDTFVPALSEDEDSPEISLVSGAPVTVSDMVTVKEKSLIEPAKITAQSTFSKPRKKVTLTMTSEEDKDEESSLETFVSVLERLVTSPESTEKKSPLKIMNNFGSIELMSPLSDSLSSAQPPLNDLWISHRDELENRDDDALPGKLLAELVSEAMPGPICHRKEGPNSLSAGNECLKEKLSMSQTDEGCTQIAEVNMASFCSTPLFDDGSKAAELYSKDLPEQHASEDPGRFGLQTLTLQNATSYDQVTSKGDSNPVENISDQEIPFVIKRSLRLKKLTIDQAGKHTDDGYKMLPEVPNYESQTNKSPIKNSRFLSYDMPNAFIFKKSLHFLPVGDGVVSACQLKRRETGYSECLHCKLMMVERVKRTKITLASINRKNIFGENALYRAALQNDVDLLHRCIRKGGNVNQPSYAGWTPLHEASAGGFYRIARELLNAGADVNIKGKYQITPLHDAVMSGHYKVAELLLLNGADPLFRSDSGKCALDKAKDSCMKRLLEKYVPKHQMCLMTVPFSELSIRYIPKPKFSSKNDIWCVHGNSSRQKEEHVQVDKRSIKVLSINKEEIYEYYQKDSTSTKFGKSKQKQSTLDQIHIQGFRKNSLQNVDNLSTNVSNDKGRRNKQNRKTRVEGGDSSQRQAIDTTSSRMNRLDPYQQHILQTLDGLSEESHKPSSPTVSSLTVDGGNNIETCSTPKETHTQRLDLSDSKEVQFLDLAPIDQTEVSLSEFSLHKEIKLPLQPPSAGKIQHNSPYKCHENNNLSKTNESLSKWKNSTSSFINSNINDGAGDNSEKTLVSKQVISSVDCEMYFNGKENVTNKEVCFQQPLSLEYHFSQESELKVDNLTTLPQQEVITLSDSDSTIISEQHVGNYEKYAYGTSFDHSSGNDEQPVACTRICSTHEASELTTQMELFRKSQDDSTGTPAPVMIQANIHIVEKVNEEEDLKRSYTDKDDSTSYSNEELPNNAEGSSIRNCEETKEKSDSQIHMPINIQNLTNRQNLLKATCSQEIQTTGTCKRTAKGESRLHLAAKRGNVSEVKALLDSRAQVNLKDNAGWTPLHEASSEGSNDVIVELLKSGADINSENLDGILPLHDAATKNHLKVAETLLQHGANPNQKDQNQKTALDVAVDEKMKELLKSYGTLETGTRDESNTELDILYKDNRNHTISVILEDIEEKQEHLLALEIRTPKDAEQYFETMSQIKEVVDKVLVKQKAERDDLAKKYRLSKESFKHGALREQLTNLATRQKSLLAVAKKQKKISLKFQNYKNVTASSELGLGKLPSSPEMPNGNECQKLTSLEKSVQPQSGSLFPASLACASMQETQLCLDTCITVPNDHQNSNICPNSESVRREEFSGNEVNYKQNINDCSMHGLSKSSYLEATENVPSRPVSFIVQEDYSQNENDLIQTTAKECKSFRSPAVVGTLNVPEISSALAHPSTVTCDQAPSYCDSKRKNKKTASQQPPKAHHKIAVLSNDSVHQMKLYFKKTASAVPCADDSRITTSASDCQHITKKSSCNAATKKKFMQIKDLMLLGKINPGNNVLEFKTQETTHKASILLSGKIKVENGQIYQNPVTWLKDLLESDSSVTWNFAWSKVTYLGKALLHYVSDDVPMPPEPTSMVPPLHQPSLPGIITEPMKRSPHFLQINEILLISDQEFLPCHIMEKHWKFYAECEELMF